MKLSPEERDEYMALKAKQWRMRNPEKALATNLRSLLKKSVTVFNIPQELVDEVIGYLPPPLKRGEYSLKRQNTLSEGDVKHEFGD